MPPSKYTTSKWCTPERFHRRVRAFSTQFHYHEPLVVVLPTSRYASIKVTITRRHTGQAGPKGVFAEDRVDVSRNCSEKGRQNRDSWIVRLYTEMGASLLMSILT